MSTGIFESLLGSEAFARLPAEVRRLHGGGDGHYRGCAEITRGSGWLSRFCALLTGLPKAQPQAPAQIAITLDAGGEVWTRNFAGQIMRSRLSAQNGLLVEQLGAIRFFFRLQTDPEGFSWHVLGARLFGIPLPAFLFANVQSRSFAQAGQYQFQVDAAMPIVGLIIRYRGQLS